jgi:adenine deaminase
MHANILNLFDRTIQETCLTISNGRIISSTTIGKENTTLPYILPGFVDAHVHIESSMLTPSQFARMAVVHGTVATVSDPHEIGNVLGLEGVEYMIKDSQRTPFKFCFGAPSCVPATVFETAGASIGLKDIRTLLGMREIGYLAEMMNYPGVLNEDPEIMAKLAMARAFNKPIDGHAPGLRGEAAKKYADAGISTDHECFTYNEANEKLSYGMNILIREGSAAKNFDALIPLIAEYPKRIMFCSDDKHPDSLEEGHINSLVKRALALGYNLFDILQAACLNPVLHYRLSVGLLREGDPADFIVVDNLTNFTVLQTYLNGELVAENGKSLLADLRSEYVNNFECTAKVPTDFICEAPNGSVALRIIKALDGQLITPAIWEEVQTNDGKIDSDVERDILKIAVVNRYKNAPVAVAFVRNFGLKEGAIASTVAHDSHNIIAIGCDDVSLCQAVNEVITMRGGIAAVSSKETRQLALPIAGLMTDIDGYTVSKEYTLLDQFVKSELKSTLTSPFMTLSFMALLVIPSLKLSDKGLFDGDKFSFVSTYK